MEQLTIFEVLNQFDENQARWENVLNNHERCTVLAFIPEDALSPLEQHYSGPGNPEKERIHKLWGNYATAIWHSLGFEDNAWEKACNKLKEYRDAKKPCPMEISRSVRFKDREYFKPEHVVAYL